MSTVYAPSTGLYFPGTSGNYVSTPDHADLDITGDLCLIIGLAARDWTPASTAGLVGKYGSVGQRSFVFVYNPSGSLTLFWTEDGSTNISLASTSTVDFENNTIGHISVTLDINNGSSNAEVKFWTSINGSDWTQLGNTRTRAVTSIFSGSSVVEIGSYVNGAVGLNEATIYYAQIYSGIGDNSQPGLGTLVAEFDASKCKPRYRDSTGKVWTVNGSDVVTERAYHD